VTTQITSQLSEPDFESYRENGYFIAEGALTLSEIDDIRNDAVSICRGTYGPVPGIEEPEPGETDDQIIAKYICIHHPQKKSGVIAKYLAHPAIVGPLTSVIGPNVKCTQSMLFIKASGKPGQAWHQDENFLATRDRSLTAAWIALDDATTENGCIWVIPGSHKSGILWPTRETTDDRFDCADEAVGFPYGDDDAIPVEVSTGSIVFFNGYLLHRSLPNRAPNGYRRALVNHYMSAESLYPNSFEFPVERADNRDIIMVVGVDPYAYKGIENRMKTQVRPERMGGCKWIE